MHRLALYSFGLLDRPLDHPANRGFRDRNEANFTAAETSPGFIARSGYDGDPGPPSWGRHLYPRFYKELGDGHSPSTLSLWTSLAAAYSFTYRDPIHRDAMRKGSQWFRRGGWPPYVLWWVDADHVPTWEEAVAHFEQLNDNGPTPQAFNFQAPFDAAGLATAVPRGAGCAVQRSVAGD
ncbi:DUF3291 domain-containing protein [Aurantimonas sp. VKM B-3413]|uniref:DUF3291 domain-containing protein n=1 Tax=Aurantimonas sp. VKM B-3413 TaxID=2779401 RepID=UPI001E5DA210|nr:DUF3291 domain-containing protein [Aurantimonas sp. VKM B-3413]MCB8838041.1 DUF3291 domain-containing protein [Aurantimonas sp. VKM B-3413]